MKILSFAFNDGEEIPPKYTCQGEEINPPLIFQDVPENAKSLVLIMDDPDAPSGDFVHWVVYNISPAVKEIGENSIPQSGVEGKTSVGESGYVGPCPPSGKHRYFFKLYALDIVLNPDNDNKKKVEFAMEGHILEKAQLIGVYSAS